MLKKILGLLISLAILSTNIVFAKEDIKEPLVEARGAVLMDAKTGRVLWGKDEDEKMPMASTTKIMSAIIILENCKLDEIVTVSEKASKAAKVRMNLSPDEEQRLEDLTYAIMMQSSNDAAVAIAEHVAGSEEAFCKLMTEKARLIGAKNTSFKTSNGLDADDHYTTAKDMAIITRYALENEKFVEIINADDYTSPKSGGDFKPYEISNKNRFLSDYEGAYGVKTGFTNLAGQCFVGAAKRDDLDLISVVFASGWGSKGREQKWVDTKEMLDYGFKYYDYYKLLEKDKYVSDIELKHSKKESLSLYLEQNLLVPLRKDEYENFSVRLYFNENIETPIKKNQSLAYAEAVLNGETLGKVNLISHENVDRNDFANSLGKIINTWKNVKEES